jgi:hypothetical protein
MTQPRRAFHLECGALATIAKDSIFPTAIFAGGRRGLPGVAR